MIRLNQIDLYRGSQILLEKASLTLAPFLKVGMIGLNGCGKSSLFAVLRGELQPLSGDVFFPPTWKIAHLAQETPALAVPAVEYVIDGDRALRDIEHRLVIAEAKNDAMAIAHLHGEFADLDGYTAHSRAAELLHGLGFTPAEQHKNVADFSGGWRMRLNLAQTLMCPSDLLLLDEPTNHLDLDAIVYLEQWLRNYQGTMLLISHDRDFLDNVVNTIVHFENKQLHLYSGDYSAFEIMRASRLATQQSAFVKQQKARQHLQKFVDKFRAKASKAKQAQSRIKALEKMELVAAVELDSPFDFSFKECGQAPNPMLTLSDVAVGYGNREVLTDIDLSLRPGQRIGLLGPNGAGKSTLIKLLGGALTPMSGIKTLANGIKIGYFAQHQLEQLNVDRSPLEHLQDIDAKTSSQQFRAFLGGFDFGHDKATSPVLPLSGGEKARLVLALLVWQCPHLLLLDEPTNHLDMEMRQALANALQDYDGTLVIVSHDRHLLRLTCDDFLLVAHGEVAPYMGDLNDYVTWLLNYKRDMLKNEKATPPPRKVDPKALREAEKHIDKLTVELKKIEELLQDPALYEANADPEKVRAYQAKQTELSAALEIAEELWLSLQ